MEQCTETIEFLPDETSVAVRLKIIKALKSVHPYKIISLSLINEADSSIKPLNHILEINWELKPHHKYLKITYLKPE